MSKSFVGFSSSLERYFELKEHWFNIINESCKELGQFDWEFVGQPFLGNGRPLIDGTALAHFINRRKLRSFQLNVTDSLAEEHVDHFGPRTLNSVQFTELKVSVYLSELSFRKATLRIKEWMAKS